MSALDIKITCEKWSWFGGTNNYDDVNFFHPDIIVNQYTKYPSLSETIDLTPYILKKNDLVFSAQKEDINQRDSSTALYRIFDSLQLTLSNLNDYPLTDFFQFFKTNYRLQVAPFMKYKFFVFYKNTLIFQGVLSSKDIAYYFPEDLNDRDTVELTVYSWDREFKDYFSSKDMQGLSYTQSSWGSLDLANISVKELLYAKYGLKDSPSSIQLVTDKGIQNKDIANWRIVQEPNLKFISGINKFFLNGYEFCKNIARFNMYDYLKYLCNSFGWLFYWDIINGQLKFIIRNRVANPSFYQARQINFNSVISWQVNLEQFEKPTEIVKMSIVEFHGGSKAFSPGGPNELGGARDLLWISQDLHLANPSINFTPWSFLQEDSSSIGVGTTKGYKHSRFSDGDNDKHHYIDYTNTDIHNYYVNKHNYYDVNKILHVPAGDNYFRFDEKRRIDFQNKRSSYFKDGMNISDWDLIFCGNVGTGMFYSGIGHEVWPYYTPGEDRVNYVYYRSEQFKQNMEALLTSHSNLVIEIKVNGFFPYANEIISFANYFNPLFGYTYDIISLQADAKEETTTYKLRQRV